MSSNNQINDPLTVVGIGASAGGLEALNTFFNYIPSDTGLCFVIVQHLSPNFKSMMNELLAKHTTMKIVIPEEDTAFEPDTIYLNRRDKNILCSSTGIRLVERDEHKALNLPIDMFFHSLGENLKERSIAIILSGTGTDGSRGIRTVKESGGIVMVQEPLSAQFDGMPNAALRTDLADYVASADKLAEMLTRFPRVLSHEILKENEEVFSRILLLIKEKCNIDFNLYKRNTLIRRIEKRMNLLNFASITDYLSLLETNENEVVLLHDEFLIGVTSFFRDIEAFDALRSIVLPKLLNRDHSQPVRIWVTGCSTGEEAYSLAILLDEFIQKKRNGMDYKIFATDIDKESLSQASTGSFPVNIISDLSEERLHNYFIRTGEYYKIIKRIRDRIVFSFHNILSDPPFIHMDFVSCRNLLIYMQPEAQEEIIRSMLFALNTGGYLFLGSSENTGQYDDDFEVVDSRSKIFRKTSEDRPLPRNTGFRTSRNYKQGRQIPVYEEKFYSQSTSHKESLYRALFERFAPPSVVVDDDFNILFSFGKLGDILKIPDGIFSTNLFNLVDDDMAALLRNGLHDAQSGSQAVVYTGIQQNDSNLAVDLRFSSMQLDRKFGNVTIIELLKNERVQPEHSIAVHSVPLDELSRRRIEELEHQIYRLKEEKQNVTEELETSNEELQSSNEELLASNEELQSTNEELQSVNEELYTVNTELQTRNRDLANLNADMDNLLKSTRIGTLFLDSDLKIRRFTPELKKVFDLQSSDIGRPIHVFANHFSGLSSDELIHASQNVVDSNEPFESEVKGTNDRIYLRRIYPFIDENGHTNGVVITFVDITTMKNAERSLSFSHQTIKHAFESGKIAWWDWDIKNDNFSFDPRKAQMLGYRADEIAPSVYAFTEMLHPDDYEKTMQAMKDHLEGRADEYKADYRIKAKDGQYKWFRDRGEIYERSSEGKPERIIGVVFDITEKQETLINLEKTLAEKETLLQEIHHRVKNNMQKIVSLLNLQEMYVSDEKILEVFENTKMRIQSMAIVHQMLYQTDDLADIDIRSYLKSLLDELKSNLESGTANIEITANIDPVTLDMDRTINLGIVLNELITNAYKYAFAGRDSGEITVELKENDKYLLLTVADNGKGIADRYSENERASLGLNLVAGIAKQYQGSFMIDRPQDGGSVFSLSIKKELRDE